MQPQNPLTVGKYEIQGMLGKGASGLVYKGFDPFVRRTVAVKTAVHLQEEPSHLRGAEAPKQAFFTEARAAGMLNHPNIVAVYDAGMEGDLCYIVMEYVKGDTLLPYTRSVGQRLPISDLLSLLTSCAQALDYSHSRGVLHRDIKPSNIMLAEDGTPKIMDFSIAEVMGGGVARANSAVGSPLYMAPEQVMRQPLTATADLYALGAVAYQLLTGQPPYLADNLPALFALIRNQPVPDPRHVREDVPDALAGMVMRLLAKLPQERYANGGELAQELLRMVPQIVGAAPGMVRRRDGLRRLPLFQRLYPAELEEVLAIASFKALKPGELLPAPEAGEFSCNVVLQGGGQFLADGRQSMVLNPGDCFYLLSSARGSAACKAHQATLLMQLLPENIARLQPATQASFLKVFAAKVAERLAAGSSSARVPT